MTTSRRRGRNQAAAPRIGIAGERPGAGGSTLSVTLAATLAARGWRVGLLGTDPRSPIVPNMFGAHRPGAAPPRSGVVDRFGVRVASLAWLRSEEEILRRKPPDICALARRVEGLAWGGLDLLMVDLPPDDDGSIRLYAMLALTGVVIVGTPRGAVEGATSAAVGRFRRLGCAVVGVIENLTYYHCPSCGREEAAQDSGAVRRVAERTGTPWLGPAPISIGLRDAMAEGRPGPHSDWTAADGAAFDSIAANMMDRVATGGRALVGTFR